MKLREAFARKTYPKGEHLHSTVGQRFVAHAQEHGEYVITDTKTRRQAVVPMYEYKGVMQALDQLFG